MMISSRRATSRRNAALRAAFACALAAFALPLGAQTLVTNPNLDTDLPPWQAFVSASPDPAGSGAAPAWVANPDVNGSSASGSALIDFLAAGTQANAASGMAQCVEFSAATSIQFVNYGMSFQVPATTTADGSVSATVEIRLFTAPGCSGFIGGGTQGQTIAPGTDASWHTVADHSFVPTGAPVTAASAQIRGYLRRTGTAATQTDYAIHLDHFVVVLNDTTPVELMQFNVD